MPEDLEDIRSDLADICAHLSVIHVALQGIAANATSHNVAVVSLSEMTAQVMDAAATMLQRISRPGVDEPRTELLPADAEGTMH